MKIDKFLINLNLILFRAYSGSNKKRSLSRSGQGMRWHPLIIKWCLYLRQQSSKAYEVLRDSGLPSQHTLRDYSNCVKAKPGFSCDVDQQLMKAGILYPLTFEMFPFCFVYIFP